MARILVVGAGAIGSLFGGRLAAAGHEVHLVGRARHVAAIRASGVTIEGRSPIRVAVPADESIPPGIAWEMALLTVKTFDLPGAAMELGRNAAARVPTLLLQNGLGVEAMAVDCLRATGWRSPERFVVRGLNSIPATLVAPGLVRQPGTGEVLLGGVDAATPPDLSERFRSTLSDAGLPARVTTDLRRSTWMKVLVNAAINPVTADHGVLNGQLAREPWRGQSRALLGDALAVAAAEGVEIDPDEAEAELGRVVRATSGNRSSMLQDLLAGRPTEIEAISGEILRIGRSHHLSLPATQRAYDRIHARATERRPPPVPEASGDSVGDEIG